MNTEEIFQQVIDEACADPLYRFAELVRQDEREQWDTSDMAHRSGGLSVEQTEKQEPVAWMYEIFGDTILTSNAKKIALVLASGKTVTPLYAAPPRKEWVGLTDDDAKEIFVTTHELTVAIRLIEAKLKERNT
jgi:hypothetical protein